MRSAGIVVGIEWRSEIDQRRLAKLRIKDKTSDPSDQEEDEVEDKKGMMGNRAKVTLIFQSFESNLFPKKKKTRSPKLSHRPTTIPSSGRPILLVVN